MCGDLENDFEDKLLSAFGDGWYEGFQAAKKLEANGEDISSTDLLFMSEHEEHMDKVGSVNKKLLARIAQLETKLKQANK